MIKVTDLIVGLMIIGLVAALFGIVMADVSTRYDIQYSEEDVNVYNQLNATRELAQEVAESEEDLDTDTGLTDVLGAIFGGAYKVLRVTKQSFTTYDTITNEAVDQAQLGEAGYSIKLFAGSIIIILIVLGVIISAVVKWYL